jgi:hypothetical protein
MDDNDLLAAVREDFTGVRMDTPTETILADGASLRRRRHRRLACGSGVTALAAVAAISGVTLTSGAASTSGTHDAQLTAWTVQKQQNGTIDVTIRDLQNLAGLEQKLKADGAPAEVISDKDYPAACVDYKAMKEDMASVITNGPSPAGITNGPTVPDEYAFVIHPAAIPSGTKLLLDVTHLITGTSGGVTTTIGGVGDRLWGFGASLKDGVGVTAGMGLVYSNGNC